MKITFKPSEGHIDKPQDIVKKTDIYKYHHYAKKDFFKNDHLVVRKLVKDIDLVTIKPQRAGVIIYTIFNNQIYFGLGVDTNSGELTDFGGGVSYKDNRDKNVILGALREFEEETLGIFKISFDDVLDSTVIYNNNILIIFKLMVIDPDMTRNVFLYQHDLSMKNNVLPEVCDIKWVTPTEFKEIIAKRGSMFHRVQNFLQQAGDFFRFL